MFTGRHFLRYLVPVIALALLVVSMGRARAAAAEGSVAATDIPRKPVAIAPAPKAAERLSTDELQWAQISGENVNVRSGPGVKNPIVTTLHAGDFIRARAGQANWLEIQWPENAPGWVLKDQINATETSGTVKSNLVKVYSQGNSRSSMIAKLDRGAKVTVVGEEGDWLMIKAPESAKAFISAKYVVTGVRAPDSGASGAPVLAKTSRKETQPLPVDEQPIEFARVASGDAGKFDDEEQARKESEAKRTQQAETARKEAEATRMKEAESARLVIEAKKKADAEERTRIEAEAKRVHDAETARIAAEEKKKADAEDLAHIEAEAKRFQEAETARLVAEARKKSEDEELARKEAEAKRVQEAETARIAAETQRKAEALELARKEAEAKRAQEAETARIAVETQRKAEALELARKEAEAKRAQEAETARIAAETQRKAEALELARKEAEVKRVQEAETARIAAENQKKADDEEFARKDAEFRRIQEVEIARLAAVARQKTIADELARKEAERKRKSEEEEAFRIADQKRLDEAEIARLAADARRKTADEERARISRESHIAIPVQEEQAQIDDSRGGFAASMALPVAEPVEPEAEIAASAAGTALQSPQSVGVGVGQPGRLPEPRLTSRIPVAKRIKDKNAPANKSPHAPIIIDDDETDQKPSQSYIPVYEKMAEAGNRVSSKFVVPQRQPLPPGEGAEVITIDDTEDSKAIK